MNLQEVPVQLILMGITGVLLLGFALLFILPSLVLWLRLWRAIRTLAQVRARAAKDGIRAFQAKLAAAVG
jgi:hypothetical protein